MRYSLILILLGTLLFSCSPPKKDKFGEPKIAPIKVGDHRLIFYKLDDYAKILINDSLVFDTQEIGLNPSDLVEVDLNIYLKEGLYNLTVEIYNAPCEFCLEGNSWEVNYEYYTNGELVDYISEKSASEYLPVGLNYTKSYENVLFSK